MRICHSGGAIGSDYTWDIAGRPYGVETRHYYYKYPTPYGNIEITEEQFKRGEQKVKEANEILKRRPEPYIELLARSWTQVEEAEAVYAINSTTNIFKMGGTAWAIQMASMAGKDVYLFDQTKEKWFFLKDNRFVHFRGDMIINTKNFAGIGTRKLFQSGIAAINQVYKNTKELENK